MEKVNALRRRYQRTLNNEDLRHERRIQYNEGIRETKAEIVARMTKHNAKPHVGTPHKNSTSDSDRKTDNAQPGTTQGPKILPQDYRMKNNSPTDNHKSSEDHHKRGITAAIFNP